MLCRAGALAIGHKVPFNNLPAPGKGQMGELLGAHGLERQVFLSKQYGTFLKPRSLNMGL